MTPSKKEIRAKAVIGLPLTAKERATFLLLIATDEEAVDFLRREKKVSR